MSPVQDLPCPYCSLGDDQTRVIHSFVLVTLHANGGNETNAIFWAGVCYAILTECPDQRVETAGTYHGFTTPKVIDVEVLTQALVPIGVALEEVIPKKK